MSGSIPGRPGAAGPKGRKAPGHLLPQYALSGLGPAAIPALLPALRATKAEELDRLLPRLRFFDDNSVLKALAREAGMLGEKARALLKAGEAE